MKQNHIIQKVFIEVNVQNKEKAYSIKDDINSFLTMDVFPKLEKYIATFQEKFPGATLQISRLTLDLDESATSLDTVLKDNIVALFEKEFEEAIKPVLESGFDTEKNSQISLLSEPEKLLQTFIYFLEKGTMPWWNSNENAINILESSVFKKVISATAFESRIASILQKSSVQERIINQLTDAQIKQICLSILKNKAFKIDFETTVIKQLSKATLAHRNVIWSLILSVLRAYLSNSSANLEEYTIQQLLKTVPVLKTTQDTTSEAQAWKEVLPLFPFVKQNQTIASAKNKTLKKSHEEQEQEQEGVQQPKKKTDSFLQNDKNEHNDTAPEEKGYYVQNAGLVLIHPFMPNLFKYCNLIDPKTHKLTNPELCIHLLHYIATGKTNQPESDMLLEKFLCNMPLHQSISRHVKLSRQHKAQAKKVIEAVQQNWSAMKTASVGLLQNEFLQRPGKLELNDSNTLTVERKAQDIFLDKLSWGIGLIKLPWQEQFIYVNW